MKSPWSPSDQAMQFEVGLLKEQGSNMFFLTRACHYQLFMSPEQPALQQDLAPRWISIDLVIATS